MNTITRYHFNVSTLPWPPRPWRRRQRLNALTLVFALGVLVFLPFAQAVTPAPDGGYPGYNTAEGQNALFSLTSGTYNTAVGFLSLRNTNGSLNTAVGAGALLANTEDQNTATGAGALLSNTSGSENTGNGAFALSSNITGALNTAIGAGTLLYNSTGSFNTALGTRALLGNNGNANTAMGSQALSTNTGGHSNTAAGHVALWANTTGSNNTAIGDNALFNNTTGSNNIALGAASGLNITTASDTICIGIVGVNVNDGCYIGHVFQEPIDPDNLAVAIDVHGKVGTPASSQRFKDDIKPMERASEVILALKPVTFHYKNDAKRSPRFGLIAEEVAKVDPNLVGRDKEGKPYSVRYDQVNAMLLNEFLKQHCTVEEQQATIAELKSTVARQQKGIDTLSAQLKEQTAQIQKVSAQLAAASPSPGGIEMRRLESQLAGNGNYPRIGRMGRDTGRGQ